MFFRGVESSGPIRFLRAMSDREAILALKASRSGYKSALSRARKVAESALKVYVEGDDPTLLENFLGHWDERLQKYLHAEDLVMCNLASDPKDADQAVDEHVTAFFTAKTTITGFRRDVDAAVLRQVAVNQPVPIPDSRQAHPAVPKLNPKKPPILEEDTDHRLFVRWRPLWYNYAQLSYLDQRERTIQVGIFWECCSPGFLSIIRHSLGIRPDTGRSVVEILDMIEAHLRSLRNVHLDMRDLLSVKQKEGQDYTSFCNSIRELADYADTSKITEDRLLIALLFQGMRSDSDKTKLMERKPSTFNEARKFILEMETIRD